MVIVTNHRLEIRTLGRCEIVLDGRPVCPARKSEWLLLAYLAARTAEPQSRGILAEAIREGARKQLDEAHALRSLSSVLYALRRALQDKAPPQQSAFFLINSTSIGLRYDGLVSADTVEFGRLAQEAAQAPSVEQRIKLSHNYH